jgi:site-specific DNA recombinase
MKTITQLPCTKVIIPKLKRVAAYARVSIEAELNLHSLEAQVDHYSKLIKATPGWEFAGVYADSGITGTKADRPGFKNLLTACDEGKVDIILAKSISRFARNTVILLSTIRHLKERGISVRFERENIDTLSSDGELMISLLAAFAQEESLSISENTKWAIRKNFAAGIGNNFRDIYGYRYNDNKFVIVPEEAKIVKLVYSSYLEGKSPDQIVLMLNRMQVKPLKGERFSYESVWLMLRQIKYTGNSILQKTYKNNHIEHKTVKNHGEVQRYFAFDTHPVIIEQATFDAVQNEIVRRKNLGFRANQSIPFNCFTSLIRCPFCGKSYRRKSYSHPGHNDKYYKWVCGTKIKEGAHGCPAFGLPEKALYSMTAEVLGTDGIVDEDLVRDRIIAITVYDHELCFSLFDGSEIRKQWKDERRNDIYGKTRITAGC